MRIDRTQSRAPLGRFRPPSFSPALSRNPARQFRCDAAVGWRNLHESREPLCDCFAWGFSACGDFFEVSVWSFPVRVFAGTHYHHRPECKAGAPCPSCVRVSRSRHTSYPRLLMDLPADGRTVNIQLVVRRFRCKNPSCRRRGLPTVPRLVRSNARRTQRLEDLMTESVSSWAVRRWPAVEDFPACPRQAGYDAASPLSMEITPAVGVRVVGIESGRGERLRYGTIGVTWSRASCGAAARARAETAARWPAGHPGIEVEPDAAECSPTRRRLGRPGRASGGPLDSLVTWGMWRSECLSAFPFRPSDSADGAFSGTTPYDEAQRP